MVKRCLPTRSPPRSRSFAALLPVLLLAWLLLAAAGAARAATPLMIWPVDPVIAGDQRAVALWVENRGTEPVALQARVLGWQQENGDDRFVAQQAVVASPPISQIPPGARQMVRLIATLPVPPGQEHAYRVLLDELPAPTAAMEAPPGAPRPAAPTTQLGVRLQIRYAIPLFVYAPGTLGPRMPATHASLLANLGVGDVLEPVLRWEVERDPAGTHHLVVRNAGPGHARLTAVRWQSAGGTDTVVTPGLLGYVLPHSHRRWELERAPPPSHELQATVNGREAPLPRAAQ
ncbi:fimbrial biogenesis chaperone [Paracidovorax konjaci]|uniref:Fimbrial chaperone protein n=1 Tax=Paracidovorax konjaci TaxID=32040 RepID=A0A1I1W272_9BURK|nr:fimbria/pilus periplasmic chaperone [Paracidovorax konjaci]SFD89386.1 fimbrial chaperone protein [Paracidovorax konjaci]